LRPESSPVEPTAPLTSLTVGDTKKPWRPRGCSGAILVGFVLFLVFFFIGSLFDSSKPTDAPSTTERPEASRTVSLNVDARLERSQVTVSGTTDLLDGAVVRCEASFQGTFDDNVVRNYESLVDLGKATVSGQAFSLQGDVGRLPPGRNKVFCAFMPLVDEQLQNVYDTYGRAGEFLIGSNVFEVPDTMRSVESEFFFEKR